MQARESETNVSGATLKYSCPVVLSMEKAVNGHARVMQDACGIRDKG